jgi:hypothetical protein
MYSPFLTGKKEFSSELKSGSGVFIFIATTYCKTKAF